MSDAGRCSRARGKRPELRPPARRRIRGLATLIGLAVAGCSSHPATSPAPSDSESSPRAVVSDGWLAMGTFFEADLRVARDGVGEARAWLDWAREEIARLEQVYSRHDPASQLSDLNRRLSSMDDAAWSQPLGDELGTILMDARAAFRATDGAFDVTIGPLVELWTATGASGVWPADDAVRSARARVGIQRLGLSRTADGVRLRPSTTGLRVDLDGLSKGAALDRLRDSLGQRMPEAAALLSFGGSSVWAIGDPGGGWRVQIRSRDPDRGSLGILRLVDRALSMSSSLGSVTEIEGRRASHVVDPRSGRPVDGTIEAIVVGSRSSETDAWSTALLVLGVDEDIVEPLTAAGLEGWVRDDSGRTIATSGWPRLWRPDARGRAERGVAYAAPGPGRVDGALSAQAQ